VKVEEKYDVVVIGGGATGAAVARDCAMRGLKTLLLEKEDFAYGTTGRCSGLLHGGPRYLLTEPEIVEASCKESGVIQRIASSLVFRVPFLLLVFKGDKYGIDLLDAYFREYDRYSRARGGRPHTVLGRREVLEANPLVSREVEGAIGFDEFGVDVFRLTLLTALSAEKHGAKLMTHCEVVDIGSSRVRFYDKVRGRLLEARFEVAVNAAGPWAPQVAKLAGARVELRLTRGTHLIYPRQLFTTAIAMQAIDGREVMLIPHQSSMLLGTTDEDHYASPDEAYPTRDEVMYLLQAAYRAVPALREVKPVRAMAGVRPLLPEWGKREEDVTRGFRVIDHEELGEASLISVVGGKMVLHRLMAEEATDLICRKLGAREKCRTHLEAIDGELSWRAEPTPRSESYCCECERVLASGVKEAVREHARTLVDVRRRTRIGMGLCQGVSCSYKAALTLAGELKLSPREALRQLRELLEERWRGRWPIAEVSSHELTELAHGVYSCLAALEVYA